ncbi:MAG: LpxI family protein [Parvularculaceae bacterium]
MADKNPSWRKLGLFAGGGALPTRIARACRAREWPIYILHITQDTDEALADYPGEKVRIGAVGAALEALRREGCDAVMLAGIVRRPNFQTLLPDLKGAAMLPRVLAAATQGDDALLSCLVGLLEEEGFAVIGADEVLDDLIAGDGPLNSYRPSADDMKDIAKGADVVRALGRLDVGQGAIVCREYVLAVEAAEGTDAMLARCAQLPREIRGAPDARRGVLFKAPKPGQERRVDLPVMGVRTIELAAQSGLAGVAVEAGGAIIIDGDAVLQAADAHGLFVYGAPRKDDAGHSK